MVRLAELADLPAVAKLLLRFHEENGIFPLAIEKFLAQVHGTYQAGLLFIAEDAGQIVGGLALRPSTPWYTEAEILGDLFFYVIPERRFAHVGKELLRAAADEGKRRNMPVFIGVANVKKAKKRGRVMDEVGFIPTGYMIRIH